MRRENSIQEFGNKFPTSRTALTCRAFRFTQFVTQSHPSNMPFVSDDPSWWPLINELYGFSYFVVAASATVIYDWALTFGQEFELIWMQRWSRMALLYISVRYIGILYAVINILPSLPSLPVTDIVSVPHQILSFPFNNVHCYGGVSDIVGQLVGYNDRNRCHSLNSTLNWMTVIVNTLLGVVIFVAFTIACGVVTAIGDIYMLGEELILSGTYQCIYEWEGDISLDSMAWVLYITWEILALCLAVWITVKHFRELRRSSTGQAIGDCFMVLMKTHVFYFVSFAVVSSFQLSHYSPNLKTKALETGTLMYTAHLEIYSIVQMFVLGPRLILSIREYHTKLVDNSDAGTGISTIAFREHGYVSTSGDV